MKYKVNDEVIIKWKDYLISAYISSGKKTWFGNRYRLIFLCDIMEYSQHKQIIYVNRWERQIIGLLKQFLGIKIW